MVDQLFLGSRNWIRFVSAYLAVKFERQLLELERSRFMRTTPDDALAAEKTESVHKVVQDSFGRVNEIVKQETATWGNQLDQAISKFQEAVKSATTAAGQVHDKELQKRPDAVQQFGAIKIQINNSDRIPGRAIFSVGSIVIDKLKVPPVVVFETVPVGGRKVRMAWQDGAGGDRDLEDLVQVSANTTAQLTIQVPEK
jgi:hypothetical protein